MTPGLAKATASLSAAALLTLAGCTTSSSSSSSRPSTRDQHWRADISYLASKLPIVHVNGVTGTSQATWNATASRLETQVPRLSDGQLFVGMLRLVALLRDDETTMYLPDRMYYPFSLTWLGSGLYFVQAPASDPDLLGARLLAIDGNPIVAVLSRLASAIDYQDTGVARAEETGPPGDFGLLNDASLLSSLGLTRSPVTENLTVRTRSGTVRTDSVDALPLAQIVRPDLDSFPAPGYLAGFSRPYWARVWPAERAVYLKYNQCQHGPGFGRFARPVLAYLREHPGYRLIVDLRDNGGGDSEPFRALIDGIRADQGLNRRGQVFGLVNGLTDSSATIDAGYLQHLTRAVLIGTAVMDPIDEYGNDSGLLKLPYFGIAIQYTTAVVNPSVRSLASPDIVVEPTVSDLAKGSDPVLAAALAYGSG